MTDQHNALQAFHDTAVLNPADLDAALAAQRETGPLHPSNRGKKLLRIDQQEGVFVYGQENAIPDPATIWAINSSNLQTGWVHWENRKKVGEIMGPLGAPPAMPTNGADWQQQICIELTGISGGDKGVEVKLQSSSNGGKQFWDSLMQALQSRPDSQHSSPAIRLRVHSYHLTTWNKEIYEPKFDIVDWMHPMTGVLLNDNDSVEQKETPAAPVQEQSADASPVVARARQRSRVSS